MTSALSFLREEVGELGIQQMLILLTVMSEEGITQIEMAERFGFKTGSISKNCKRLSKITHDGKENIHGLGLIKLVPDPQKYRRLGCWLTPKGLKLRMNLISTLGK